LFRSWGTAVSAVLQASRLSTSDGQGTARGAITFIRPWLANILGVAILLAGIGVMAGTSGGETVTWNRGSDTWNVLHYSLHEAVEDGLGAAGGGADAVLAAIPQADDWLDQMTDAFWRFSIPWIVCLVFSAVAAVVMGMACVVQVVTLSRQINSINTEVRRVKTASGTGTGSTSSSLTANLERREGLVRVLRNVIATSSVLALSMIGYVVSCIVGELASNRTPIFQIHRGE
jgi:hypothetical protein